MININKITVFNFEGAFRGLRNPMNSWDKSDSNYCAYLDFDCPDCPKLSNCPMDDEGMAFLIGTNDLVLAQRMIGAGTDESKFMRQIFVSMDIEAPLYW